jgi:hypothetical protein
MALPKTAGKKQTNKQNKLVPRQRTTKTNPLSVRPAFLPQAIKARPQEFGQDKKPKNKHKQL